MAKNKTIKKIILSIITTIILIIGTILYNIFGYTIFIKPKKPIETNNKISERGHLLNSEYIATIKKDDINNYFPEKSDLEGDITDIPKYDIDLYKIIYSSIYNESIVELSGLILLPKKDGKISHIQYHHGTLLPFPEINGWGELDAPSLYKGTAPNSHKESHEVRLFGNYFASYGYLISMPDYAGFGSSSDIEHPYSINQELAKQSVDMILATKEFAKNNGIDINEEIFLTGWSEGGAVSVATQKLLEEYYTDKIKVVANAEMSGLLNTTGIFKTVLSILPYVNYDMGKDLDFVTWAYYSYNKFSDNPIPFEKIYKIPVNNELDILTNRGTNIPSNVFKKLDKKSYQHMINQAEKNNLAKNWKPIAPIFIHHGIEDTIVGYKNNADLAFKNYIENGSNAKLIGYDGHSHGSLKLLYLKNVISEFENIQSK